MPGHQTEGAGPAHAGVAAGDDPPLPQTALLIGAGLIWIVYALSYAFLGRGTTATLQAVVGLGNLGMGAWAMLRPGRWQRQRAWDVAVGLAALGLVAVALLSGYSRAMATWFLVVIPPVAAYQRGVRSAIRWGVAVGVMVVAIHVSERVVPIEPEFLADPLELLAAQLLMVALVLGFGVSVRRNNDAGERRQAVTDAKLQAMADNIDVAVAMTDAAGRVLFINAAACRMLGVDEADCGSLYGKRTVDLLRDRLRSLGLDPRAEVEAMQSQVAGGRPSLRREMALPGGITLEHDYVPVALGDGRHGHLWSFRDITERKAVERLKDEFTTSVSHELRTPLTSLQGALKLIEAQGSGSMGSQERELLRIARTHGDRLESLIINLLELQEIRVGALEPRRSAWPLAPFVDGLVERLQPEASSADIEIHPTCPPDIVVVADPDCMTRALSALLLNAVKCSPRDGVVRVHARAGERTIRVSVQDDGPGLSPEQASHPFELFPPARGGQAARARANAGAGLVMARAIMERHGGRIGVDSTPEGGATFWIEVEGEQSARHAPPASA